MLQSQWIPIIFTLLNFHGITALDVNNASMSANLTQNLCGNVQCDYGTNESLTNCTNIPGGCYNFFAAIPALQSPYARRALPPFPRPISTQWQAVADHPAWIELDNYDCGENAADRIIGGLNAALGQFPWIARLGYVSLNHSKIEKEIKLTMVYVSSSGDLVSVDCHVVVAEDNETDWMCGGVLVTDRHIVTAAHCTQMHPDDEFQLSFVRLGEYDTRTNPDCQAGVCAPVIQDRLVNRTLIRNHPKFNKPPFHNDISIIQLEVPVELNNFVAPICLPRENEMAPLPLGELVTVAGWGKMNMSTDERAEILQYVALPIVEPSVCNSLGRGFKLAESEICAGAQKNKDACGGDSGGPLTKVYDTPEGPKSYLVGVVSFGPTICGIKKPGVYSSASYFLKWILDNIVS